MTRARLFLIERGDGVLVDDGTIWIRVGLGDLELEDRVVGAEDRHGLAIGPARMLYRFA